MKNKTLIYLPLYILSSIIFNSCAQQIECKQGINLLPMYGNIQKYKDQLDSDKEFLELSDKHQPDRATTAIEMLDNGWYYIYQGQYDTAIKRIKPGLAFRQHQYYYLRLICSYTRFNSEK